MRHATAQNQAACIAASSVYSGSMSTDEAVESLRSEYAVNDTSARDFIHIYRALVDGRTFLRGMSAGAMDTFMSDILTSHGQRGISNAVASLQQHIDRTVRAFSSTMRSMRSVLEKYQAYAEPLESSEKLAEALEAAVAASASLSSEARRGRLAGADTLPRVSLAIVKVFRRNPDVVAEALARADGTCEEYHCPAPFLRAKDGTPYLEVHHRKTLANGGEDTVENAIALCPNCHRKAHYGSG